MHGFVYQHDRPEIYFKGTARMCVGPGRPLGIRGDSRFTVPEPELAVVLGSAGRIVGYTIANGAAARDIERENPLYRTQARSYQSSCALGPAIVTPDQLPDPYRLEMSCAIERDGELVFSGSVSTSSLHRRLDALIAYLLRSNPVPPGSVLLTGTGVVVPAEAALRPGDLVRVRIPEIGELSNPTAVV
jgi:2-dehydro-3-deoxy-D-arabinonate dehydratase